MATEDGVDTLKLYWDHFFKAETGTYEKSTWLDLFLAEFLIRINNGADAKELINFCPVSGVVTLVGCELLCGIHRVTSSVNTHYSPLARDSAYSENTTGVDGEEPESEKPEDPRLRSASLFTRTNAQTSEQILRKYLLGGVAWRCLVLLRALGVEGLSCCRQLSSVLIWLFGELSLTHSAQAASAPAAPLPPRRTTTPIHMLFSERIWSKRPSSSQGSKSNSPPEKGPANMRARGAGGPAGAEGRGRARASRSDSSESADCTDDLEVFARSLAPRAPPADTFRYYDSSTRSSNDIGDPYAAPHSSPRRPKPKVDDHATEEHRRILSAEIGAFEFALLVTDLLRELCRAESGLAGAEGAQVATQCVNFALRGLRSLQLTEPSAARAALHRALTELLMVALDRVLVRPELCARLIDDGALPTLVGILEGIVSDRGGGDAAGARDAAAASDSLEAVFGVAYSIVALFHCLLARSRTVDRLREFADRFRLHAESVRGGLLGRAVETMLRIPLADEAAAVALLKKLVEAIGRLVGGMKRARAEALHSAACPRARHKACRRRVAAGLHHHHAVLGAPPPAPGACAVALLHGALAALLADEAVASRPAARDKVLRTMLACGACCCVPSAALAETLVRLTLAHAGAAGACLRLLERTVYGELGAAVLAPRASARLPCGVCEPRAGPPARALAFLVHYNSLLQLDNREAVLRATVAHLLRVAPRCRAEARRELLFGVVYPTFIVAKHRFAMRPEGAARFVIAACLDMFAGLLGAPHFAELFVRRGGLGYVLELAPLPEFAPRCCAVLELAIVVEISERDRDLADLRSVRMLFRSLADATERCFVLCELKLPPEEEAPAAAASGARSAPIPIEAGRAESSVSLCVEAPLDVLKTAATFWKSCAALCSVSRAFRAHVAAEGALAAGGRLLRAALRRLAAGCAPPDLRLLLRLLEALLAVHLALADVTDNRSKETSVELVRRALVPGGGVRANGAVLRPLCEALIRVASAEPRHHAMPRLAAAKIPPLVCPSGGSSAECSSSEESVAAVYASEHSDPPLRQDEGYEADVEVGKFDLLPPYKNKKMSSSLSTINTLSGQGILPEALGLECPEYSKNGDLTHPELCIIVVDILTQLIDKVVSSKAKEASAVRAGAALARACSGRLSAAAGAGRGAAPLLHRVLSAPAVRALLTSRDHQLDELQRGVLELVGVLGSWSVEPREAALLLRMATSPRAPLAPLLHTLRALVRPQHHTPHCILAFPVPPARTDDNSVSGIADDFVHMTVNGVSSQSHAADVSARKLHAAHVDNGISSIWSVGAMRCGVEGAGWAPWMNGFAMLVWIRPDDNTHAKEDTADSSDLESDNKHAKGSKHTIRTKPRLDCAHVMSIGHDSLMFEMWLDAYSDELLFRLTRPETTRNLIISEGRVPTGSLLKQWSCVAMNVQERVYKKNMFIQVTVFINGYECETLSLPITGILVRKVSPTHVVLGHVARAHTTYGYHLAGAGVYRSPALDAPRALHITAHGAHSHCMVRCEAPNYPSLLTPEVLDSNVDWDQVYEMSSSSLRELHDNLLLSFSASSPSIINLYHQTAPPPPVFAGAGGGAPRGASIPEALFPSWNGAPLPLRHRGLSTALALLHPLDMLLFLYARVVELGGTAQEQAEALGILLVTCAHDDALYAAFHTSPTTDMLLTVFSSSKCTLHPHLLKVILESACSAPLLRICGAAVSVASHSDAVVLEPALLVLLAKAAAKFDATRDFAWEEAEGGGGAGTLWALTLRCLRVLVRPSHPRRAFNHYQLTRVDLMHHLLLACKERFLNSDTGPMSAHASESFVWLMRGLTGEPPALHRLATLCDFLLLMHQASDTFVTHSRANFYFLLTSETQEMSEYNTLLRKSSERAKRRLDRPSYSSEEISTDNSLNALENKDENAEGEENDFAAPDKEMKGIINAQIKEGRKHYVSSTSDASDTAPELAEGSENEGKPPEQQADNKLSNGGGAGAPGDIDEYIVVDADDVNHTTVEMYSSGIYHQEGRVRAGAAPGWAGSAGLLLLLRDTIALLPDHDLNQAVMGAIQSEVIVVLANQRCAAVRAGVVRVLAALQRRAPPDFHKKLHSMYYYIHLANQISLYEGSWELATACAALITKCDVTLEDQLDDDIWVDVTEESLSRSPPLLAILPCCLHDAPLALAILKIIRRIVDKASLKLLNEVSLVEVLVRTVRALGVRGETKEDNVLDAVYEALIDVALKALSAQHSMQTVVDIHHMLAHVEQSAGEAGGAASAARDAQAALFTAQLDHLEERLHASYNEHRSGNYFANVLTSAVSLGSGGGGRGELAARLAAVASRAVSFLQSASPADPLPGRPLALLERLAVLLSAGASEASSRPKWWAGGGAEWGGALQELVSWALAGQAAGPPVLRALYPRRPPRPHDPPACRKLAVYLLTMLQGVHGAAEGGGARTEYAITDWARAWALALQADLERRLPPDALALEAAACRQQDALRWAKAAARAALHRAKVVFGKEGLSLRVSEAAMGVTRAAVEAQNAERKRFMEHLRRAGAAAAAASAAWDALLEAHTHEQGVFHDPGSYPSAWALDPTEGAGRVRVRLRRTALKIHPKFLKPEHRHKAEVNVAPPPLASVLSCGGARGGVVARLQLNETVSYMARAVCVSPAHDTHGELLLSDRCIHFVPDDGSPPAAPPARRKLGTPAAASERRPSARSWPLEKVIRVETRRWCLQEVAVELFLSTGHAHLVAFADVAERGAFLKALGQCHLPYRIEADSLSEAMAQWRSGAITNWEYLMRLNGLGGRSYNDLMQYPVLPFVLADYSSRLLDLDSPASFRDLSRPVAVQNRAREQHYINTYNDLKVARREGSSPLLSSQPHHYASLYSNSGGVLHYLLRVPPFTELFLNYQDNNFDMPDRTFHSLATTWRLITRDSHTDVKELIPELFYLPELFRNNEGLNFGRRQCGAAIDDVELPPWAADARLFTLAHRQALEARAVTEALPAWIDLVFGHKQTGQAAVDAINVYPACTYYGFDPGALEDAGDRVAAAAMVRTYGQAPRRLLRAPHPQAATDLAHGAAATDRGVFGGVAGLRWGRYCGSPALGLPAVSARRACAAAAAVAPTPAPRAAVAVARNTIPLALFGDTSQNQAGGRAPLGLVSWGHSDDVVRLKRRQHAAPDLLLYVPPVDQITKVAAASIASEWPHPLFVGTSSGRVLAVRVRTYGSGARVRVRSRVLLAHECAIADMHVCAASALLATASRDGRIVLWDLNTLTYIRTLPNRDMLRASHVTISATLSDVASAHDTAPAGDGAVADADAHDDYEKDAHKYKSLIRVHTCNGLFVGSVKVPEGVSSVVYSHAPEGVSVNSLAVGLASGGVRFYCSWDLRPTLYLAPDTAAPLLSLAYSSDSSVLFGCYEGDAVSAWEAPATRAKPSPVRILSPHALY